MKFLLFIFILFSTPGIKNMNFTPYTKTGHEQFEEFTVPKGRTILITLSDNEIHRKYDDVPFALFGTKEVYFDKYIPVKYKSTVIFSRSNKTRESYVFSYDLETVKYKNVSVKVTGNLSAKAVFKTKKVEVQAEGDISMSYATETYVKTTESGSMNIVIQPNKKVTLRIVGDARITNGVSKYYLFGICFKKGAFEIVEIQSTIYELLEEDA